MRAQNDWHTEEGVSGAAPGGGGLGLGEDVPGELG